jgi:hypothetical protein
MYSLKGRHWPENSQGVLATYQYDLMERFKDIEARDEAYGDFEIVRSGGDIRVIFTKIQMCND